MLLVVYYNSTIAMIISIVIIIMIIIVSWQTVPCSPAAETNQHIYIYIYIYIYVYTYMYMYIYIYIYIYRGPILLFHANVFKTGDVIGVSMVPAQFIKFNHGLCKSWILALLPSPRLGVPEANFPNASSSPEECFFHRHRYRVMRRCTLGNMYP